MNIIDILVLVVLGFSLFAGMHKGFLASLLSTLFLVGSWIGAQRVFRFLADYALNNRTLMGVLSTYLEPAGFFEGITVSGVTAQTPVAELISRGGNTINAVAEFLGEKVPFIKEALVSNISSERFADLNITTVADYFDQTLWQGIFNVLAFIVALLAIYFVLTLLVNLLNHVFRFYAVRKIDWLLGGILGLVRGAVFAALILSVLEPALSMFDVEMMATLRDGSKTYELLIGGGGLTFLTQWMRDLVMTGGRSIVG